MNIKYFSAYIISVLFILSCNTNTEFSEKQYFDNNIWNKNDTVIFNTNIKDTNNFFSIYIDINASQHFKTSNLWLEIQSISPTGTVQTDTLNYFIFDNKGKWFGEKNGNFIKNKFLYKNNIRFPIKGFYSFQIIQLMRQKQSPHVEYAGITIKKLQ